LDKPTKLTAGIGAAGVVCALAGLIAPPPLGWPAAWIAIACARVALAYRRNEPEVFGKRDGRLSVGRAALVLPYLLAFRLACFVMRRWRRYPRLHRVDARFYVGGRLRRGDLPTDVARVIDLTSEFSEPAALRRLPGYRCLPLLDGACPADEEAFCAMLEDVAAAAGAVVFHCESGLGRAPTAAALAMVRTGAAPDAASALERIRAARPMVRPTSVDLDFIRRIEPRVQRMRRGAGSLHAEGRAAVPSAAATGPQDP
jgi:protein-tyrosine phosphatase